MIAQTNQCTFDKNVGSENFINILLDYILITDTTWYLVNKNTLYHDLISLIISQRIAFSLGRQIREKLKAEHEKINQNRIFKPEIIQKLDLKTIGISNDNLINCINFVTNLELAGKLEIENIKTIKGIGDWTYNALQIMGYGNSNNNIFLKEDAWIRKRLAQLVYGKAKSITQKEAENIIKDASSIIANKNVFLTTLSLFLWRIKESGITKIRENKQLLKDDFI